MVAAQQKEILRILDLVCEQQANRFQRLFPTIDIVAQKQIIGLWREAAVLEQSQEIIVLAVNVSYVFFVSN